MLDPSQLSIKYIKYTFTVTYIKYQKNNRAKNLIIKQMSLDSQKRSCFGRTIRLPYRLYQRNTALCLTSDTSIRMLKLQLPRTMSFFLSDSDERNGWSELGWLTFSLHLNPVCTWTWLFVVGRQFRHGICSRIFIWRHFKRHCEPCAGAGGYGPSPAAGVGWGRDCGGGVSSGRGKRPLARHEIIGPKISLFFPFHIYFHVISQKCRFRK